MIDPVSTELRRRIEEAWPWRRAAVAALLLHAALAAIAVFAPPARRRPLTLPSVQVRVAALPAPAAPAAASPDTRPATTRGPAPPPPRKAAPKPTEPHAAKPASRTERPAGKPAGATRGPRSTAVPAPENPAGVDGGVVRSGGLSVGPSAAGGAEAFPFQYYLSRLLALVEGNWFRPPTSPGTSCRVRCRIDRTGALREVGIEQASGNPAFDRAALRAVYACSPLPPLPQGYGGSDLTLHLEFGP